MTSPSPEQEDTYGLIQGAHTRDPYPIYARMRREAPVQYSETTKGWIVTSYREAQAILRDPRFSSDRAASYSRALPPPLKEKLAPLIRNLAAWVVFSDPPAHTRLRGLINKTFSTRMVEGLRPRIQAIVDELVDGIAGAEQADLVRDLAYPLPVLVISEMLGLPAGDRDRLKHWSDALAAFAGAARPSPPLIDAALRGVLEMEDYFRAVVAERRRAPGADLVSTLLAAEEQGAVLSEQELISTCILVLFAGHETTTNLIGSAAYTWLRHPDQLAIVKASPEVVASAVEESLRYEAPVQRLGRIATADVEIGGRPVRAGDHVFMAIGAVNRDPDQFPDPDRFDVRRADNRHLSFGLGQHFCVGAQLGRVEAQLALATLFRRLPDLALTGDSPEWLDNLMIRGLRALPVRPRG